LIGTIRARRIGAPIRDRRETPVRRTLLASAVAAVLACLGLPALAGPPDPPVGVTYDVKDGISVGTTIGGQPGAGANVRNGRACVGFSYQVPQCVDLGPVTR